VVIDFGEREYADEPTHPSVRPGGQLLHLASRSLSALVL
jgi:hypothetical protein